MLGVVKRLVCNYTAFSVSRPMFSHLWAALLESAPVGRTKGGRSRRWVTFLLPIVFFHTWKWTINMSVFYMAIIFNQQ